MLAALALGRLPHVQKPNVTQAGCRIPVCRQSERQRLEDTDTLFPDRQERTRPESEDDAVCPRTLWRQSSVGAQVLCDLVSLRPYARVHGRHDVIVALRGDARPAEVRRRDTRL